MTLKKIHFIGFTFGIIILILNFIFFYGDSTQDKNLFLFIFGISATIMVLPFIIDIMVTNRRDEQIGQMFLEFSRNLAESVNTGTPISKSIVNMRKKNYGSLSPYIDKLANQIELGIPIHKALRNFAVDVNSEVISRAVALIMEAERAGGDIDYILESVAKSISEVEKLKKERKASIYNLVVQGYIIFFIFIGIMLVMQFKILPLTSGIGSIGSLAGNVNSIQDATTAGARAVSQALSPESLSRQFLYLLLAQGFFAGLTIGKLAEGSLKAGFKHSFVLVTAAFLIATGANAYKFFTG
jgi:pilus assembly protein TadC